MKRMNKTEAAIFNIKHTTRVEEFLEHKADNADLLKDMKRNDAEIKRINLTDDRKFFIVDFQYTGSHGLNKYAKLYELTDDGVFYDMSHLFINSKIYKTYGIGCAYSMSNCWGFSFYSHINDARANIFDYSKL